MNNMLGALAKQSGPDIRNAPTIQDEHGRRWNRKRSVCVIECTVFAILSGLMYVMMLNGHFGYDSTFYFVTGEDWAHGVVPYSHYIAAYPPGVYLVTRLMISWLGTSQYVLHAATLAVNFILIGVTVSACRRWIRDNRLRLMLAIMMLVLGFMTEMIYLLTDQTMATFGVIGFWVLSSVFLRQRPAVAYVISGMAFGCSFLFKASAGFYVIAAIGFLLSKLVTARGLFKTGVAWQAILALALFSAGFALPLAAAGLWAWRAGILSPMVFQSFWVPLLYFPGHHAYLGSFLLKLGPFIGVWLGAIVLWVKKGQNCEAARKEWFYGLIMFSLCSMVALVKNQSSHYLIAALPFMAMLIIGLLELYVAKVGDRVLATAAIILACLVFVAGIVNHQKLMARFQFPDFEEERRLAHGLAQLTRPGEKALFLNGVSKSSSFCYWITGLRPPRSWPYLAIDVGSYSLAHSHQGDLLKSVLAESTALVSIVPEESPFYLGWPWPFSRNEMDATMRILKERFEPVTVVNGVPVRGLWKKRGRSAATWGRVSGGPYRDPS